MVRPDELELLRAWAEGDEAAGRALFERCFDPLYRFFSNKIDQGIEDLIQETFLACVEARDNYRGDASFQSFVLGVARNRLYKRWRHDQRHGARLDFGVTSVADMSPSPSSVAGRHENRDRLLLALREIPADLQVALELHYWEALPASGIAAVLQIPEGTARSRLRRAREALLRVLQRQGGASTSTLGEDELRAWAQSIRDRLTSEGASLEASIRNDAD